MEREMREEMAAHIAQAAERFVASGMSERDALLAARREFGQLGVVQEQARDARGGQWVDGVVSDLKYAFRYFARTPLSSTIIVLTLALGIGFSSAVFSALTGILTRPAPGVPNDPALVKIRGRSDVRPYDRLLSYPELSAYAELSDKFESVAGWVATDVVIDVGERDVGAVRTTAQFVTPNFFRVLGVRLAAGREFGQSTFHQRFPAEMTAVISDAIAVEQFGGPRAAVGRRVKINDVAVTIVGVTEPRFAGAVRSRESRMIWMPMSAWQPIAKVNEAVFTNPNARGFEAFARLRPGVAAADALPQVRVVAARVDADARLRLARKWTGTADVARLRGLVKVDEGFSELGPGAVGFTAIALLILLVCTTTVNSLLVGAAISRRHEIGVRLALGASRSRIVRQLLTEISILALLGGALGLWTFGALTRLTELAEAGFDIAPNWTTAVFTLLYAVATATLSGLSPALHATRAGLSDVLKDSQSGATRKSRLQRVFVVAQIAIAQPLMVILAAVMTNLLNQIPLATNVALRERLVIADFDTYIAGRQITSDKIPALIRRLGEIPGVDAVLPIGYGSGLTTLEVRVPAAPNETIQRYRFSASLVEAPPEYFRTVDIPIARGREFVAGDTARALLPVIVSDSLASLMFGDGDPIGRRLYRLSVDDENPTEEEAVEAEVVGVARLSVETTTLDFPSGYPPMFVPFKRRGEGRLLIRTAGPAKTLIPTIRTVAREEARLVPLLRVGTLAEADRRRRENRLMAIGAVASFGMIALSLASIGLYAMLRIGVEQRRREIGIRVALGAHAQQVVVMFFTSGVRVALIGLAIGLPITVAGFVLLRHASPNFEIRLTASAAIVMIAVMSIACLASWLPARRAARVDPMLALRSE
jgi:predicted permease